MICWNFKWYPKYNLGLVLVRCVLREWREGGSVTADYLPLNAAKSRVHYSAPPLPTPSLKSLSSLVLSRLLFAGC